MTDDLNALADRIKAPTGPDRELEIAICRAIGWHPAGVDVRLLQNGGTSWLYEHGAPAYTASLDAALTLVPEGWSRRSTWCPKAHFPARWSLHPPGPVPAVNEDMAVQSVGYTDPLALCAAALRARAQQEGQR